MEKKIEQYLPFYIDAIEVQCPKQIGWKHSQKRHPLTLSFLYEHRDKKIIPILRPLSSMTEDEKLELYTMGFTHNKGMQILHPSEWKSFTPEQFKKLLEWGIDIFGLKEKGLCLYPEEL